MELNNFKVDFIVNEKVPAIFPSYENCCPNLIGYDYSLVPLDLEKHITDLYNSTHSNKEVEKLVWTYYNNGPFENQEEMTKTYKALLSNENYIVFCAIENKTNKPIGIMTYMRINPLNLVIEIGHIWFIPEYQGKGANPQLCYLLIKNAIENLGFRRIEWKCDNLNERSKISALKLGFTFEGVFRQDVIIKGRNRDTAWFSIIKSEWPAVKEKLEIKMSLYRKNKDI